MRIHCDDALTHVGPRQVVVLVFGVGANGADETRAPLVLQRKDDEKIGGVQGAVQLAVHHRAARVDVGDVKQMVVRAARETDPQAPRARLSARRRSRRDRLASHAFGDAIGTSEAGAHTRRCFLERHEFRPPLDLDAGFSETIDQQALVFVLRIDQRIRKRTEIRAHLPENDVSQPVYRRSRD